MRDVSMRRRGLARELEHVDQGLRDDHAGGSDGMTFCKTLQPENEKGGIIERTL